MEVNAIRFKFNDEVLKGTYMEVFGVLVLFFEERKRIYIFDATKSGICFPTFLPRASHSYNSSEPSYNSQIVVACIAAKGLLLKNGHSSCPSYPSTQLCKYLVALKSFIGRVSAQEKGNAGC